MKPSLLLSSALAVLLPFGVLAQAGAAPDGNPAAAPPPTSSASFPPTSPPPSVAAAPAGSDLLEVFNDLVTYDGKTPGPILRALEGLAHLAAQSAPSSGSSCLRQPAGTAALWSGVMFRAVADGAVDSSGIATRADTLAAASAALKGAIDPVKAALLVVRKEFEEKKTPDSTAFLKAAAAALPEAGQLPLSPLEKELLDRLVKEKGFAGLGFLKAGTPVLANAGESPAPAPAPTPAPTPAPAPPSPPTPPAAATSPAGEAAAFPTVVGYNSLGFDLFRALRSQPGNAVANDRNLVISPVSIGAVTEALWMGSRKETSKELGTVLRLEKNDQPPALSAPPSFVTGLPFGKKENGTTLLMANDLWLMKDWQPLPDYEAAVKARLTAGVRKLGKPANAAETINTHLSEVTGGKVRKLLNPQDITANTRLVISNAVYFKAPWETKFDPKKSTPGEFQITSGGKRQATFMKAEFEVPYAEAGGVQVVSLPFAGKAQRMVLLLPPGGAQELEKLESSLTQDSLVKMLGQLRPTKVKLGIPRFRLDTTSSLKELFQALHVNLPFSDSDADFSGISSKGDLHVSAFRHQAVIEANEEGAEATAATAAAVGVRSVSMSPEFTADHPFLFAVLDESTGAVLFLGRMAEPAGATPSDTKSPKNGSNKTRK